MLNDLRRWSRT